jgi:DNA-binding beta-propeller fold protein YncE
MNDAPGRDFAEQEDPVNGMDSNEQWRTFLDAAIGVPPGQLTVASVRRRLVRRRVTRALEAAGVVAVVAAVVGATAAVRVFGAAPGPAGRPTAPETIYVAYPAQSHKPHAFTFAAINPVTRKVKKTFHVQCGCNVISTPDGKTLYVTTGNSIIPISTATNQPGKPIHIGNDNAWYMQIAPNGKTAYVGGFGNEIIPVNLATNKPGKPIHINDAGPPEFTPDGKTAWVLSSTARSSTVTPIDTATNKPGKPIHSAPAQSMVLAPDGKAAYTVGSHTFTPINLTTGKSGKTIQVPKGVEQIVITPNGKTVYVAVNAGNKGYVTPINTTTDTAGKAIQVLSAEELAITPNGKTVYATSSEGPNHALTPISTATNKPGTPILNVGYPWIAITPDGKTLYAASGDNVTPVNTTTNKPGKPIVTDDGTAWGVVIAP